VETANRRIETNPVVISLIFLLYSTPKRSKSFHHLIKLGQHLPLMSTFLELEDNEPTLKFISKCQRIPKSYTAENFRVRLGDSLGHYRHTDAGALRHDLLSQLCKLWTFKNWTWKPLQKSAKSGKSRDFGIPKLILQTWCDLIR
jgi:hypothetical protein